MQHRIVKIKRHSRILENLLLSMVSASFFLGGFVVAEENEVHNITRANSLIDVSVLPEPIVALTWDQLSEEESQRFAKPLLVDFRAIAERHGLKLSENKESEGLISLLELTLVSDGTTTAGSLSLSYYQDSEFLRKGKKYSIRANIKNKLSIFMCPSDALPQSISSNIEKLILEVKSELERGQ